MLEANINTFSDPWRSVVARWGKMNKACLKEIDDLPAWYVENSNSALFAAAAWLCGYPAICEIDIEKRKFNGRPGRPRTGSGRFDIEMHMGNSIYLIEAKKRHLSISADSHYSLRHSHLASAIDEASADCRACEKSARNLGMEMASLVFFSGSIDEDSEERKKVPGYRQAMSECLEAEIGKFKDNMEQLELPRGIRVLGYSLFANDPNQFNRKEWKGFSWPALFGVIGLHYPALGE